METNYKNCTIEDLKCCGNCIHAMHIAPVSNIPGYSFVCRKKIKSSCDHVCKDWLWDTLEKENRIIK